jgi:hypothetical protein
MGARRDLARRHAESARCTAARRGNHKQGRSRKAGRNRQLIYQPPMPHPFGRRRVPRGGSGLDWISERPRQHAIRLRKSQKSSADCCHTGHGRDRRHWRCLVCCRSRVWPEVKPSIHFIETGDRAERRVASRLRDSSRSNPCRHSCQKFVVTQEGIDHHIAHLSPSCVSQTCRKRRHRLVRHALRVASDVFEGEGNSAPLRWPPARPTAVGN